MRPSCVDFKPATLEKEQVSLYYCVIETLAFLAARVPDVVRFANLGTTEQRDSAANFRVDYLKPSGAIGFYHPDWVAVQKDGNAEVNWIIETKGRVWEGTGAKDEAIEDWCKRVSKQAGQVWCFTRVNQVDFDSRKPKTLGDAVKPLCRIALLPGAAPRVGIGCAK